MSDEEPKWLTRAEVDYIHDQVIEKVGGLPGTRDANVLESALRKPQNHYYYMGVEDIHALAAAYAEGIARNHAFADGNKRTALISSDIFLQRNGHMLQAETANELTDLMNELAQGKVSQERFSAYMLQHSKPFQAQLYGPNNLKVRLFSYSGEEGAPSPSKAEQVLLARSLDESHLGKA